MLRKKDGRLKVAATETTASEVVMDLAFDF
jgi:hypothetical protein